MVPVANIILVLYNPCVIMCLSTTQTEHNIMTTKELPEDGQYVLAYFPDRPWIDDDCRNDEHKWVVVKFVRGMSKAERAALPDTDGRKRCYGGADEDGNNLKPYMWDAFGPSSFFGQDAACWCALPVLTVRLPGVIHPAQIEVTWS